MLYFITVSLCSFITLFFGHLQSPIWHIEPPTRGILADKSMSVKSPQQSKLTHSRVQVKNLVCNRNALVTLATASQHSTCDRAWHPQTF